MMHGVKVYRYRRVLDRGLKVSVPQSGFSFRTMRSEDAVPLHALLSEAYADGFGWVPPLDPWWKALRTDAEFDAELVHLVFTPSGALAAGCISWTSAFVKDIAVSQN